MSVEEILKKISINKVKGIYIPENMIEIQAESLEQFQQFLSNHGLSFSNVYLREEKTSFAHRYRFYAFALENGVPVVLKYVQDTTNKNTNLGETEGATSVFVPSSRESLPSLSSLSRIKNRS